MPFTNVWIHFVWTTKNSYPFLSTPDIRQQVFRHIRENAFEKKIYADFVNGYNNHVHCLVSLGVTQSMSDVMRMLKGESSHWINKNGICRMRFEWQEEYYAESVNKEHLYNLREYIRNQEEHHSKKTFRQEYEKFVKEVEVPGG